MQTLFQEISDNLLFVAVSAAILIGLILLAKLAERFLPQIRMVSSARRVSIIGICAALAAVLHILDFPLLFLVPGFYKTDFSELPVLLCGFYLGPCAAVICEGVKILLKLLLKGTSTAFVGELANFAAGCSLALPATIVYHCKKTKASAIWGLALGTAIMTVFVPVFNAVYLLPKFAQLYGIPLDTIISMGTSIHSGVQNITSFVILCVAPQNLIKGTLASLLTMLLYKRVAGSLFSK